MDSAGRWYGDKALRLSLLTITPFLVWWVDYHSGKGDFSFCLFKLMTGRACYGCGTLRGLSALLHLDFDAALRLNPLNLLTLPLFCALYVREWIRALRQPSIA